MPTHANSFEGKKKCSRHREPRGHTTVLRLVLALVAAHVLLVLRLASEVPASASSLRALAKKQDEQYETYLRENDNPYWAGKKRGQAKISGALRRPSRMAAAEQAKRDAFAVRSGSSPKKRRQRSERQIAIRQEYLVRRDRLAHRTVDQERCAREAEAMWQEECRLRLLPDQANTLEVSDPAVSARLEHPFAMHLAKRRTPWGRSLSRALRTPRSGRGAPAKNIDIPASIIERIIYETDTPKINRLYTDLTVGSFPLLEKVYDSPAGNGDGTLRLSAVYEAINGRRGRGPSEYEPGILDRVDPDFLADALVETSAWLRDHSGAKNAGRVVSIDGTKAPLNLEQQQSVSMRHEELLNGRFGENESAFGSHGDQAWRGKNVLILVDPFRPQSAMNASMPLSTVKEPNGAIPLLQDYFDRHLKVLGREDLAVERLLADRGFFDKKFAEDLVFRFGIQPVVPWKGGTHSIDWGDNFGVPYCECTGTRVDMHYDQQNGFKNPRQRAALGLRPGDDIRETSIRLPRLRYKCLRCGATEELDPSKAAHIYTKLPHKGDPRNKHFRERLDLQPARNSSEAFNAAIKSRGFAVDSAQKAKCIKSERQFKWYFRGRLVSLNLERIVVYDGTFASVCDEIHREHLTRPGVYNRGVQAGLFSPEEGQAAA